MNLIEICDFNFFFATHEFQLKATKEQNDLVYDNNDIVIFVMNEKLKRAQRNKIKESIEKMVENGEFVYYEF